MELIWDQLFTYSPSANPVRVTMFIHKVIALQQKVAKRSLDRETEHDIEHKTLPINNSRNNNTSRSHS